MKYRAIYYDTETTGVRPDKDRITEIAAYDPINNKTFESLVNPGVPIPEEAAAITGITDKMVKDAPDFSIVGKQFLQFCEGSVILIAHNNDSFDKLFLENEYARHGLDLPKFHYIDTLKWSRKYRSDLPKHALQYLREIYGIKENNAHRALDDVMVLHQVFSQMIDDLPIQTVVELLAQKGPMIKQMPFGKHKGTPLEQIPKNYLSWLAKSGALEKPGNQELKTALTSLGLVF